MRPERETWADLWNFIKKFGHCPESSEVLLLEAVVVLIMNPLTFYFELILHCKKVLNISYLVSPNVSYLT